MIKKFSIIISLGCMLSNAPSMLDCMGKMVYALCGTQQANPAPVEQEAAAIINVRFSGLGGIIPGVSVNIPADTSSEEANDMLSACFPSQPGIILKFLYNGHELDPLNTMRLLNGHNNPIVRMVKDRSLADLAEVLAGLKYTPGAQDVTYNGQVFRFEIGSLPKSRQVGEEITVENIHELQTSMVSFEHLDDEFIPRDVEHTIEILGIADMMNSFNGSEISRMTKSKVDAEIQQARGKLLIGERDGQTLFNVHL